MALAELRADASTLKIRFHLLWAGSGPSWMRRDPEVCGRSKWGPFQVAAGVPFSLAVTTFTFLMQTCTVEDNLSLTALRGGLALRKRRFVMRVCCLSLLLIVLGACTDMGLVPVKTVQPQGTTLTISGEIREVIPEPDPLFIEDLPGGSRSVALPAKVRVSTYQVGIENPISVADLNAFPPDHEFSGSIQAGDSYRIAALDAQGAPTDWGIVYATATDGTSTWVAFPREDFSDETYEDGYELVRSQETLTISGTFSSEEPDGALPTQIRLMIHHDGLSHNVQVVSLTVDTDNQVSHISASVPVFPVFGTCVYGETVDATGAGLDAGFSGTASTPTVTYVASEPVGGGVLFQQAPAQKLLFSSWKKKPDGVWQYNTKIGNVVPSPGTEARIFCFQCPINPGAGPVPVNQTRVTAPQIVYCDDPRDSVLTGQGIVIGCAHTVNARIQRFRAAPFRYTGAVYKFWAEEPVTNTLGGKPVFDYTWYQANKIEAKYTKPGAGGDVECPLAPPKPWGWDSPAINGVPANPANSYPIQGTGSTGTTDVNGMGDQPSVAVPMNDGAANAQTGAMGMPAADQGTWKTITVTYTYETYMVCCQTNTVEATWTWSMTVTISRVPGAGGGNTYSSDVSSTPPTPVEGDPRTAGFDALAGAPPAFPC